MIIWPNGATESMGERRVQIRGFTLVELLVVVAIVGVLIAILVPALRSARETTVTTVCQSNLRQMMVGWQIAMNESDASIPYMYSTWLHPNWLDLMELAYLDQRSVHLNDVRSFTTCPTVEQRYPNVGYFNDPYGYTVNTLWEAGDAVDTYTQNELQSWLSVRHPATYPWFMDAQVFDSSGSLDVARRVPYPKLGAPDWGIGMHHDHGEIANVAYADSSSRKASAEPVRAEMNGPTPFAWLDHR